MKWILYFISIPYLHFGDFDLKGIHIYITEFRNKIGAEKCSFFIPPNILAQIRDNGLSERYDKQIEPLKNFNFDVYDEIKVLAQFIHECKKGLPQEILIQ